MQKKSLITLVFFIAWTLSSFGQQTFNTIPVVTTVSVTSITTTLATINAEVNNQGGGIVTERGIVWSTSGNPTVNNNRVASGSGTGNYSVILTGLTGNNKYFVRAYAINNYGIAYGGELTFVTLVGLATLTTNNIITQSLTAFSGGKITDIGGSFVSARGVVWGTSSGPTIAGNKTTDGNGLGSFESNLTGLTPSTTYFLRAYATNNTGTAYGNELTFTTTATTQVVTDIDGNTYNTVQIGNQIWMRENLKTTRYRKGGSIPYVLGNSDWQALTTGAWSYYNHDAANNAVYGKLYNWYTTKGDTLCPAGWHVPTNAEWATLTTYLGGRSVAGGKMKSVGTAYWNSQNTSATNESGFSALPSHGDDYAYFWSAAENYTDYAYNFYLVSHFDGASRNYNYGSDFKSNGASVRCLNDSISAILTTNIPCPGTPTVKDIDGNIYNTVQIGNQCWTKENLKVSKYNDGTTIPLDTSGGPGGNGTGQTWVSRSTGARTINSNDNTNFATYGYLYNWYAVRGIVTVGSTSYKNLCPTGYHVPTDSDWNKLVKFIDLDADTTSNSRLQSESAGTLLKKNAALWTTNKGTDYLGFSALPGGSRYNDGSFGSKDIAFFWSVTQNGGNAWFRYLLENNPNVYRSSVYNKSFGASVRCLKDSISITTGSIPTISTIQGTEITSISAKSGGNLSSDGGAAVTSRGVVWSTSTNPTISLSTKTSDGSGTGSFTSSLSGLSPSTTYYVKAYATNSVGTAYGNEVTFTTTNSNNVTGIPCPGIPTVKDIDGNTYNTVQIGTQCWTKENLKVTKYNDGTAIPLEATGGSTGASSTWRDLTTGSYTINGNESSTGANATVYGFLYNWYAAKGITTTGSTTYKNLCPTGWHVPTDAEWTIMIQALDPFQVVNSTNVLTFAGSQSATAGNNIKSSGTTYWGPSNAATNESGFSALPGGFRNTSGSFIIIRVDAFFWSATESGNNNPWYRQLASGYGDVARANYYYKSFGASIRCLRDTNSIVSIPKLTTTTITAITTNSATSGGSITADGSAPITARGVVWSTSTNPTITLTTKTTDGTGTGTFSSSLKGLSPNTTYYIRAYATNSAGTGYGNEVTFTTFNSPSAMNIPCPGTPTVQDIDGNSYNTVQIGTQCWTTTNLKVTKYNDGTLIPDLTASTSNPWAPTSGARTGYDVSVVLLSDYVGTFGYLYNWYAVNDLRKLCPDGWHVPTDADWTNLIQFIDPTASAAAVGVQSDTAGTVMKSAVTNTSAGSGLGWDPGSPGTNTRGFSALPGGIRNSDGSFSSIRISNLYWSATESDASNAWYRILSFSRGSVFRYKDFWISKSGGASVRCLRDSNSIVSIPKLTTTTAITAITTTSAISGGSITSDGGASITNRGVVWSTSTNPTISLTTKTSDGSGIGSFPSNLTGLSPNTTYYVRAYATNSAGTGYGNEITFRTIIPVVLPTLSTVSASSITTTTATTGGNITSDGWAPITARGVVWSTSTNPTITLTTKTSDGSGFGSFSSTLTGLTPNTTYYVRAYATNSAGTSYGNEITFTTTNSNNLTGIPCPGIPTVKDIDGNTYNTVQIGNQCWTKENLKVSKYRNGTPIPTILDSAGTIHNNDSANEAIYGKLYNWYAVVNYRGLCPTGWHVPTDAEWTTLTTYLGGLGVAGGKMKSTGITYWSSPNTGATNESGFSALPSGYVESNVGLRPSGRGSAFYWSATESGVGGDAWSRKLNDYDGFVNRSLYNWHNGFSVRCLRDTNSIVSIPKLTTTAITAITTNSATSGGSITADGSAPITARGVVCSTSTNPTISLTTKTSDGSGTGAFLSSLTGLSPNTTYYVRAYATNSAGTGYGNEITFRTILPVVLPTLSTVSASSITTTTATTGGNITSDGWAPITARGVVWSTSTNPTISLTTKTSDGSGFGSFSSTLTGLSPNTTYYVRAYATNSAGTGYGNEVTFTTSPKNPNTVVFYTPYFNVTCDTLIEMPLLVNNFIGIIGAQGSINWDATKLKYEGISSFGPSSLRLTLSDFGITDVLKGKLSFVWNASNSSAITLPDSTSFFIIKFKLINSQETSASVKISNDPLDIELINSNYEKINYEIGNYFSNQTCFKVSGKIQNPKGLNIPGVTISLSNSGGSKTTSTDVMGDFSFTNHPMANYSLIPSKLAESNPRSGISIFDLALIQAHIIGKKPLETAYQIIAADINGSSTITTADLIMLKKFILGSESNINGRLYSFVDKKHIFSNPKNPFPFPQSIIINSTQNLVVGDFIGVKVGDINLDNIPQNFEPKANRNRKIEFLYEILSPDLSNRSNEVIYRIKSAKEQDLLGMQFTLNWDSKLADMLAIENNSLGFDFANVSGSNGLLGLGWISNNGLSKILNENEVVLEIRLKLKSKFNKPALNIIDDLLEKEAFDDNFNLKELSLKLDNNLDANDLSQYKLFVFPNPAQNNFTLTFNSNKAEKGFVQVTDMLGRSIINQEVEINKGLNNRLFNIPDHIVPGIYNIQLRTSKNFETLKLLLKNQN